MVVVETPDAILVAHMDETQHVKKVVDALKREGRPEGELHRKVFRPWGWYDGVDSGERFQVKRIVVKPVPPCRYRCITIGRNTGLWSVAQRR